MCVANISRVQELNPPFKTADKKAVENVERFNNAGKIPYTGDALALSTFYLKTMLVVLNNCYKSFEHSIYYKILFHTTQPAHLITAIAVISLSLMMIPSEKKSADSPLWTLIYLASFSSHFGAQLWMTFVSGLSLYFTMPRHTFGRVQRVLFPKYFLMNSILSLITLYVFLRSHKHDINSPEIAIQVGVMTLCFFIEMVIRLYLTPPLIHLIRIKTRIESDAGIGMEIGKLLATDLLKCPHYRTIHKGFRKIHVTIAIGNVITMACTMFHLYYLSQRICHL